MHFDIAMSVYNKSKIYILNFKYLQNILSNYNEFPLAISDELKSETLQGGYFIVNKLKSGAFCENWKSFQKMFQTIRLSFEFCVKGIVDRENRSEIRSKIMKM